MIDQSEFTNQQEVIQAPPEVMAQEALRKSREYKGRSRLIYLAAFLGMVFLILTVLLVIVSQRTQNEPAPEITPTPQPESPPTRTKLELERLRGLVDWANPKENDMPPPDVDMKVEF